MTLSDVQELWLHHAALSEEVARLRKAVGKLEEHSHDIAQGVRALQESADAIERALRALGRPPSGTFRPNEDEEPTSKRKRPIKPPKEPK